MGIKKNVSVNMITVLAIDFHGISKKLDVKLGQRSKTICKTLKNEL